MVVDRTFLGIESNLDDGDGLEALACPRCGEATGLHLDDVIVGGAGGAVVEVTTGGGEDACAIPRVTVAPTGSSSDRAKRAQLSMTGLRRHYIKIVGWCEHCGQGEFGIVFKQHKGMTYVAVVDEL